MTMLENLNRGYQTPSKEKSALEVAERIEKMKLSARNQLKGKVVEIKEGAVNGIVIIDIGGGNKISSTISMSAIKELGLEVGKEAYAVIKATSVMVGIDD